MYLYMVKGITSSFLFSCSFLFCGEKNALYYTDDTKSRLLFAIKTLVQIISSLKNNKLLCKIARYEWITYEHIENTACLPSL